MRGLEKEIHSLKLKSSTKVSPSSSSKKSTSTQENIVLTYTTQPLPKKKKILSSHPLVLGQLIFSGRLPKL